MTDKEALDNTILICCKTAKEAEKVGFVHVAFGHKKLAEWLTELREYRTAREEIRQRTIGLAERYVNTPLGHIHISDDPIYNAFSDGVCLQAMRIWGNLQKALPDKDKKEISDLMFFGEEK